MAGTIGINHTRTFIGQTIPYVIKDLSGAGTHLQAGNGPRNSSPYHFNTLTSSRLKVDLPRYREITSARPMAASEAATAMMKRVKI